MTRQQCQAIGTYLVSGVEPAETSGITTKLIESQMQNWTKTEMALIIYSCIDTRNAIELRETMSKRQVMKGK